MKAEDVERGLAANRSRAPSRPACYLGHLDGLRCLLSTWIVLNHFIPKSSGTSLNRLINRANVAVDAFIVLSGFITQWAYGHRNLLASRGTLLQFYARRVGRVLLTTYLAMILAVVLFLWSGEDPGVGHSVRCFLFVEPWLHPDRWCPNGQTWTVAALLPSWLLYPLFGRLVSSLGRSYGCKGLGVLLLFAWAVENGLILHQFFDQGRYLSLDDHYMWYTWPPSQIADFVIGVCAAEITLVHRRSVASLDSSSEPVYVWHRTAADVAAFILISVLVVLPASGYREGWEPLLNHGLAAPIAAIFGLTAVTNRQGIFGSFLAHPVLRELGAYSFEVFLFQWPVHHAFSMGGLAESCEDFFLLVFTLWVFSGVYAEYFEHPAARWIRAATAAWGTEEASLGCLPSSQDFRGPSSPSAEAKPLVR